MQGNMRLANAVPRCTLPPMLEPEPSAEDVAAGAAPYTARMLRAYEPVLAFTLRALWRCPKHHVLELYNRHGGARHIDIGVGTGYMLDRCSWPVADPQITLVDLNPATLDCASRRIARYAPRTLMASVLDDLPLPSGEYDSVGCSHVLHCVPGGMRRKTAALGEHRRLLAPGGSVFGATLLGTRDVHTPWSRAACAHLNRLRAFFNADDDVETLRAGLEAHFDTYELRVVGAVALFSARA
jgi:ubiquinone/menaquinone biosynthesis C-methylase UbiE